MIKVEEVINLFINDGEYADEICFNYGEDKDGQFHVIFDSWADRERFVEEAKKLMGDEKLKDYEVESKLEMELVFSDEYANCSNCNNIIRISPDSYSWQPDFYMGDGEILCGTCFKDSEQHQALYIEEKINNPKTAINGLIEEEQLEALGFVKFNAEESFENGWYTGQTDSPQEIYDALSERFHEVVFFIDGVGQFDTHFSAFVRSEIEMEEEE